MSQAAKLVRENLSRLVLKGVRVHRVEVEVVLARESAKLRSIFRLVPRNVQRHGRRRPDEFENSGAILQLFVNVPRFAGLWEASETCSTGSDAPRRNSDAKLLSPRGQIIDIDVVAPKLLSEVFVIAFERSHMFRVLLLDEFVFDLKARAHNSPQKAILKPAIDRNDVAGCLR